MKRARHRISPLPGAPVAAGRTVPVKGEATGTQTEPGDDRYARLRLPHERDEDIHAVTGPPNRRVEQAASDLDEGREDTEGYTEAPRNFERANPKRPR